MFRWLSKKTAIAVIAVIVLLLCINLNIQGAEQGDEAESFRYGNGAAQSEDMGEGTVGFFADAWKRGSRGYYSSDGSVIKGAYAKGIDVSHHNGTIDWQAVKDDGVEFAIIRCGYGQDSESQDDSCWEDNVAGCEAVGMPYGVYLYSYADTTKKAVSEAEHVLRLIKGHKLSYPVYYDMEDESVFGTTTKKQRGKIAEAFCETIAAAGYDVAVYANKYAFTNALSEKTFDQWDRWVAQYNTACSYEGTYAMWQATDEGRVSGITGDVDIDFLISDQIFLKPTVKVAAAGKKKVKVTWKPRKKNTTCHIYYAKEKKNKQTGKYKSVTKKAKKGKKKIKGLKSGKRYYVKVRISRVQNGVTVYSKYSKTKKIKVK